MWAAKGRPERSRLPVGDTSYPRGVRPGLLSPTPSSCLHAAALSMGLKWLSYEAPCLVRNLFRLHRA